MPVETLITLMTDAMSQWYICKCVRTYVCVFYFEGLRKAIMKMFLAFFIHSILTGLRGGTKKSRSCPIVHYKDVELLLLMNHFWMLGCLKNLYAGDVWKRTISPFSPIPLPTPPTLSQTKKSGGCLVSFGVLNLLYEEDT